MFCISISKRPIPNSTADKTKKKKVKEITFILSKKDPRVKTMTYSVIHNNSAVKSRCKADVTLTTILDINKKNIMMYKLTSPKFKF